MKPLYSKNRTIGILGGSFNPAHEGHLHITLHALKKLRCDAVWWLVSPQNPLKSAQDMAAYEKRFRSAQGMAAAHPRIYVSGIEAEHGLRYSWQTVALLKRRFPGTRFIWMMGADNLTQFHRWEKWQSIARAVPVVVFDRVPHSHTMPRSPAYYYMKRFLLKNNQLAGIFLPPCFFYSHLKRHPLSATLLRKKLGEKAFLRHNEPVRRMKRLA